VPFSFFLPFYHVNTSEASISLVDFDTTPVKLLF